MLRSVILCAGLVSCAIPVLAASISGTVFEDMNYGGGAGRSLAASSGAVQSGARVELFNATGNFVSFATTNASGAYSFAGVARASYTVRVVNSSIVSSRTGYVAGVLPVQTYRTNAPAGAAVAVTDRVGGEVPSKADAGNGATTLAALTTATTAPQSIASVTSAGPNVTGVDFGFNFDTIVNVNEAGQGSLGQFITNANTLGNTGLAIVGQTAGRDVSIFMVSDGAAHAGLRAGIANLLTAGVAVITVTSALPSISASATTLDGSTQASNVGNTNAVTLGTGGTVGVDAIALVENNVLSASATSFTDPGPALRDYTGVYLDGSTSATIRYNLIGFTQGSGVYLTNSAASCAFTGNEIRNAGTTVADREGLTVETVLNNTFTGNLIAGSSSQGARIDGSPTSGNTFTNNTFIGNGVGTASSITEDMAIAIRNGPTTTTLDRNVIRANYGAGIQVNSGASSTVITRNSIYDNGTITARTGGAATGQIGIDLTAAADDQNFGTAPFVTLNDNGDGDAGGNGLLNYPVLVTASLSGTNTIVTGYARPGSVIELFGAAADGSGFGEGQTYVVTPTEGGTGAGGNDPYADTDAGTGTYGPGAINGVAQGTDNTNKFAFTFPTPGALGAGNKLTATATLGGQTSGFSGTVTSVALNADLAITLTDAPDPAPNGGKFLYTALITNNGPGAATSCVFRDTLPAGVTLASATTSQGSVSGTTIIVANLGAILSGGTATVEILVTTSGTGTLTDRAYISAAEPDLVAANNVSSATTTVANTSTSDIPLTPFARVHGFVDVAVTGGSLRTTPNSVNSCTVGASSTAALSGIPGTATIRNAYLYWAGSGQTIDNQVTLDGASLTADRTFQGISGIGGTVEYHFGGFKDVTAQVTAKRNGNYTFSGLTVATGAPYCAGTTVLAGWSLIVIYDDPSLSGKTLVLYDGFDITRNGASSYLLSGIYASAPTEAKATFLVWEGDETLSGATESLKLNGTALSDALNPVNNVYNSTINSLGSSTAYGMDLDTFDVSALIAPFDRLATAVISTGSDLVIANAVLLEVKSNVITGHVFEDVNYGGAAGRDFATATAAAPAFTVARPNATVELYDSSGNLLRTTTTAPGGEYVFVGLIDGDYDVRCVNSSVRSSRPGATGNEWPVQTYRADASTGASVAVTDAVGGALPGSQDSGANPGAANLSTLTAQSVTRAKVITGISVTDVDFGYSFDVVVNRNNAGQGSLRQFLTNANVLGNTGLAQAGRPAAIDNACFMLADGTARPGIRAAYPSMFAGGIAMIVPATVLPTIFDPLVLNAQTQPGWSSAPMFEINGTSLAANAFTIAAGASTLRGFAVNRFNNQAGVVLSGAGGNTIAGNYLGVDSSGTVASGPMFEGIQIVGVPSNTIGGTAAQDRNVIGGCLHGAVSISGAGATGNVILGNSLGVDAAGTGGIANESGVSANIGGNTIGGTAAGARNLIGGNTLYGVALSGGANTVTGNWIGLNAAGTGAIGNQFGIYVTSGANVIGDTTAVSRNVISGGLYGVYVSGAAATGNTIRGNYIGTSWDGTSAVANGTGVLLADAAGNTIGGLTAAAANLIARNSGRGVGVTGATALNNGILLNSITTNGGLGIDLGVVGVTVNNGTKSGVLPNSDMDFPAFTSAVLGVGQLTVAGYVGSAASQAAFANARVDVFKSDNDSSGFGEGATYLGTLNAGASGNFAGTLAVAGLAAGDKITATATDAANNTSEFGANATVQPLALIKRAYDLNGNPIATGAVIAKGAVVNWLLYVTNPGPAITDVSLRDVLAAGFAYVPGTIRTSNSVAACATGTCTGAEEAAIFAATNAAAVASDAVDGDAVSRAGAAIDLGNQNAGNGQLNIAANKAYAVTFKVRMQ